MYTSKRQIYDKWTVYEHKCHSSFLFFRFPSNWERERGYTKFGIRRNSPKGTYLISLMEFRGEYFFFYGLIDFMLFLILAWRTWVLRVRDIFCLLLPGILALVRLPATNPVQRLTFLLSISADGKESPLPFWDPTLSFGFSFLPPGQAIHLGYYMSPKSGYWVQIACPNLLSCLNSHSPTACHC